MFGPRHISIRAVHEDTLRLGARLRAEGAPVDITGMPVSFRLGTGYTQGSGVLSLTESSSEVAVNGPAGTVDIAIDTNALTPRAYVAQLRIGDRTYLTADVAIDRRVPAP